MKIKYEALNDLESGKKRKQIEEKYNIKKNTLCGWIKNKKKIFKILDMVMLTLTLKLFE